ncbi:SWF or SNF family helicase [Streptomyces sp. NPDC089919]|uniref:SWIM zinc finger family protein n=1 Tax=Streptomyces sp. NPDC089919 TaxID=3155188 RepID=UPI003422F16F
MNRRTDDPADGPEGPVLTFAALPPAAGGRAFAGTWWGRSWLHALEASALDGQQLRQGRRSARAGAVGAVSVRPGRLTAVVTDGDGTAHRTDVLVRPLDDRDWARFLALAAAEAGYVAALLDREVPPGLDRDATAAGVELLPGAGDLEPACDCGEWDHCAHTAALCYQVARLLDQDPFVLLLMRGRTERAVLDGLAQGSAPPPSGAGPDGPDGAEPAGMPAAEAFGTAGVLPPLPALPGLPAVPGQPPLLEAEAEPDGGIDVDALWFLAESAAGTAHRLLARALEPDHPEHPATAPLTPDQDAVRLAAEAADARVLARLAAGTGRDRAGLARAVRAWRYGGPAGLAVLEEEWAPGPAGLARARAALAAAWEEGERPDLRAAGNRWTLADGSAQLRYGRDGRWWPYRQDRGHWAPAGGAEADPAAALAAAEPEEA